MAVSRRSEKPTSAEETAKVLRIFDMLLEELDIRWMGLREELPVTGFLEALAIADRIAYRCEDE